MGRRSHEVDELRARWLELTHDVLPARARAEGWRLRLDHCFMRVVLDQLAQRRWDEVIERPAVRSMTASQIREAIRLAERLAAEGPALLELWDDESLAWRGAAPRRPGPDRGHR
jgi:hypothetical protein